MHPFIHVVVENTVSLKITCVNVKPISSFSFRSVLSSVGFVAIMLSLIITLTTLKFWQRLDITVLDDVPNIIDDLPHVLPNITTFIVNSVVDYLIHIMFITRNGKLVGW